ncbi:cob(I)yrinic acid a,c-diamide adenosyltransferase [Mycoplasmatota bacterium]|nr:cob(I)yrinic acid a,c-diamide adenosyltransferase [Mycoplasmatota bacterium]
MKIYTKNGDSGKTSLLNERVTKTNLRIEVNGQIDELMVMLAFLIEDIKDKEEVKLYQDLKEVYKNLFMITSMIADVNNQYNFGIKEKSIDKLEKEIDCITQDLPKLKHFIYYTGNQTAMLCHQVRAKVRSVERIVVALYEKEEIDNLILLYLNRLSDYFYTLARYINIQSGNEEDTLNF